YAFVILLMDAGWGLPLATLAAIVIAASLAFMVERLVFRRLYRAPGTTSFTAALGLSTAIQAGVIVVLSGTPRQVGGSWISNVIQIGSIRISGPRAMAIVGSMIALGALAAFLTIGKFGKAIRAVAQNNDAAQMVGIPISRIRVITMLLAGVLAGWAASLIAPIFGAMPSMGVLLTLKSMAIVIAGGLGSGGGALIGAYVLGISEALVAGYISHDYQHALAVVLWAVALLLRAGGMFGGRTVGGWRAHRGVRPRHQRGPGGGIHIARLPARPRLCAVGGLPAASSGRNVRGGNCGDGVAAMKLARILGVVLAVILVGLPAIIGT